MSEPLHPAYRFTTEAQWNACQFQGADRRTTESRIGMKPFAPYKLPNEPLWRGQAHAPAVTEDFVLVWRDDSGGLLRLQYGEDKPIRTSAPPALAAADRIIAVGGMLWTVNACGVVQAFDEVTLTPEFEVDLGDFVAADIASDSREGLYVLGSLDGRTQVMHLGCSGKPDEVIELDEPSNASELTFLGATKTLVLLGANQSLYFVSAEDGRTKVVVSLSALRGCFEFEALGSDGCSRLFVAGKDGAARGGKHQILLLDTEGDLLGVARVLGSVNGLVATRTNLMVATDSALLRFEPTNTVPENSGSVAAVLITPLLRSPSKVSQKWIRVEAKVELPPGCSLEISIASPADDEDRAKAEQILSDENMPTAMKFAEWRRYVDISPFSYRGDPSGGSIAELLSAPLQDVRNEYLWIEVSLVAAPGGKMPRLSGLAIHYPGATLIENLPAIYRRDELEQGDFVRSLVGLLEAGTQNLDETIRDLGRHIHPRTAEGHWLDYVASWLGLPWENGLTVDQKRRIVSSASAIADGYATRSGLEELLAGLMPERPRRFRVVDMTAQFGLATIHGGGCEGSRLPAILGGVPSTATELGNNSVLGKARLTCKDGDAGSHLTGHVRIDVAATDEERLAWEPWLKTLVGSMLPATVHGQVRWLARHTFDADRLLNEFRLEEEPVGRLGTDSVTGSARLGGRAKTMLPTRLTRNSTLQ